MAITAAEKGYESVILPAQNAAECECIDNIRVLPAETLTQVVDHLKGKSLIQPIEHIEYVQLLKDRQIQSDLRFVKGQMLARKAL